MTEFCKKPFGQERPSLQKAKSLSRKTSYRSRMSFRYDERFFLWPEVRDEMVAKEKNWPENIWSQKVRQAASKISKKFSKLLPMNEIIYYINVDYKVGW